MKRSFNIIICLGILSAPVIAQDTGDTSVSYIGNEGVLITSSSKNVLIDALHTFYGPEYLFPDENLRSDIIEGNGKFSKIDLILVSHVHGDHFNPSLVARFLRSHQETTLISSNQVIDSVLLYLENPDDKLLSRIKAFSTADLQKKYSINGINLTLYTFPHASERFQWIQNTASLVDIGGVQFLHTGDADINKEDVGNFKIHQKEIDVGIFPYWFLTSEQGAENVKSLINPKWYIAIHIPPTASEGNLKKLSISWPGVIVFSKKGDSISSWK